MKTKWKGWSLAFLVTIVVAACGGGGGGTSASGQMETTIDTPQKAASAFVATSRTNADFFALVRWAEVMLQSIDNDLGRPEPLYARGVYRHNEWPCAGGGTMKVSGTVSLNGNRDFNLSVAMEACTLGGTRIDGRFELRGTIHKDMSVIRMQVTMKKLAIATENPVEFDGVLDIDNSGGKYRLTLNGDISGAGVKTRYDDYHVAISGEGALEAQMIRGRFEILESPDACLSGKYEVDTVVPIADGGKLNINGALFTYHTDGSADIVFEGGNTIVKRDAGTVCSRK